MANQNGSVYGLTLLCPILNDKHEVPSHDLQIRKYLAELYTDARSPFAIAPGTHMARLAVMDDVIYVGMPACEESLKSKYLVFESNCDGDMDNYLRRTGGGDSGASGCDLEALHRVSGDSGRNEVSRLYEGVPD